MALVTGVPMVAAALALQVPAPATPTQPVQADLGAYRGLGTWVSIYSGSTLADPQRAAAGMKARGVKTLFLETANWRIRQTVSRPKAVAAMLEAAHAEGLKVVAWYLPGYRDLRTDEHRAKAALAFTTRKGERFDGFALDIEATEVRDIATRNRQADRLARSLREFVGPDYTLGAIVPEANALYWVGFPYRTVSRHFDVWLPMAYFTFRVDGPAAVRSWMGRNLSALRGWGDPVHPIGGIAEDARREEIRAFVASARSRGAIGASLYDFNGTGESAWAELRRVPQGEAGAARG
jgi:hypothetical protein